MRLLELHFSSKSQSLLERGPPQRNPLVFGLGEVLVLGQVLLGQGLRVVEVGDGGGGLRELVVLVDVVGVAGEVVLAQVVPIEEVLAEVVPVEEVGVVLVVVLVVVVLVMVQVGIEVVVLAGGHVVLLGHVILLGLVVSERRDGLGLLVLLGVVVGLHVVVEPVGLRGLSVDLDLAEAAETAESREGVLLGIGIGFGIGEGGHRDGENHNL